MIDPDGFDLVAQPGHGLESRIPGTILSIPEDVIAPDVHYLHPYQREIESLEYNSFQTDITNIKCGTHGSSGTLHNPSLASIKGIWIDKEKDLERLAARINDTKNSIREIAVDLEAHSFRSFSGFVCLMQLSLRRPTVSDDMLADPLDGGDNIDTGYDFLIDTLALRRVVNTHLAPIFANPDIVKVMHGANSDIEWLQRDFGIYVVNLFDTGRAARLIPFITSASLAYLLRKYAGVEADKKHQLSDWRQRPLPSEMLSYAASDTLYLLDIYDALRIELSKCEQKNSEINIKTALDDSKKVCLARYSKAPFKPEDYIKLMMSKRGKSNCNLTENQKLALKSLCDWRDRVARDEDESLHYVCSNSGLLRIASTSPSSISVLQTCVNPLPPLVLKFATEVLGIIKKSQGRDFVSFTPLLSKPNIIRQENADSEHVHIKVQDESSSSEDAEVSGIMTDKANRDFTSVDYTPHCLEMNAPLKGVGSRSKSVNGIGAAKAVLTDADEQSRIAEICAIRIRGHLASGKQNLLGMVHGSFFDDENKQEDSFNDEETATNDDDNEEDDYTLPKSMKEIYQSEFIK
jgi:ribonuclease D